MQKNDWFLTFVSLGQGGVVNSKVKRFKTDVDEVKTAKQWGFNEFYKTVVLWRYC